jgi:hypothetical protein
MARTISAPALAKLATQYGTEPVTIIEIQWVAGGPRLSYADKEISGVSQGRIITLSGLDDVVAVSDGTQSQQISVVLDDSDLALKGIIDSHDIHQRPCWVYQYFTGLSTSDKFLIFKGTLNSPIVWNEGARTLAVDVISKIEEIQIGFSVEEGTFPGAPDELVGKAWPLCFGTVINSPALKANRIRKGTLAQGTGIRDFTLDKRISAANKIVCPNTFNGYTGVSLNNGKLKISVSYNPDDDCSRAKCEELEKLGLELTEQKAYEISPVVIFGGNQFPQGKIIELDINGGKFTGKFNGEVFTILSRKHPDDDGTGKIIKNAQQKTVTDRCGDNPTNLTVPTTYANNAALALASKKSWSNYNRLQEAGFFWAGPGSMVTFGGDTTIVYIVNLLPSTILRVAAWRTLDGIRRLATVPTAYYTIRSVDYTGYHSVTEVVLPTLLSNRDKKAGGGWEDDLYVTHTSSIGPNTVDILTWIIQTYSSYGIDTASFNSVKTAVDGYPMHFPLLERKSLLQVLQEIAYQARCAIWLKDDVFYLKYLAAEPTVDDTITEDDVIQNSLQLDHSPTEDVVTKSVITWRADYSKESPNTIILQYNVKDYGTHEADFDFYCFNVLDLVRKAGSFWGIRKGNTWRKAKFQTPLNKLTLETFDCVGMTLPDIADGTIKAIVEKANYNSDSHTIDFECWTPCRAGTRVPYGYSWTAQFDETVIFPTDEDFDLRKVRGGKDPNFSTIAPVNHELSSNNNTTGGTGNNSVHLDDFVQCTDGTHIPFSRTGPNLFNGSSSCPGQDFDLRPGKKPDPPAKQDSAGNTSTADSPGLITNPYYKLPQKSEDTANRAADQSMQARADAESAREDSGSNDDKEEDTDDAKKKLPDEQGGNCTNVVVIIYITPTLVTDTDGFFQIEDGKQGALNDGNPGKTEYYTFNQTAAAKAFRDEKQAEITARAEAYAWTIGEEQTWLVSCDPDLGIDEDPESENFGQACPEPGTEDAMMTAFHSEPGP